MKIECTKEEFKALLDLVYAGNVLINGMRSKEERIEEYAEAEQKIFAMAKEFELDHVIEYSEEFKEYMPTADYEEEGVDEYIDAYDTQVFWEELVMRLARRDALNYVGDVDQNMTKAQLKEMQMNLEEKYEEEIQEHGLSRLKIVKLTEENA
jgi:hypothetical protein